jgi:hypothetical protein
MEDARMMHFVEIYALSAAVAVIATAAMAFIW